MKTMIAMLAAVPALFAAVPALADSIDFAQFGNAGTNVPSPAVGVTNAGVPFAITSPNASFGEYQEGTSWIGEFAAGEVILFDGFGPGPVTINFTTPVTSILHLEAQANAYGAFTETLTAFDGLTNLGSVSADAFNYVDTAYEGTLPYLDFSAPSITSITISTTNDSVGFALGGTGGVNNPVPGVPEPATWAMLVGGFALMGASLRRTRTTVSYA